MSAQYEFDKSQNATITKLAASMKFVAVFELVGGVLYAILGVFSLLGGQIPDAVWYIGIGVATILIAVAVSAASRYFRAVVDTKGDDIAHMMTALDHLRGAFNVQRIMILVMLALVVISFVLVLV